MLAKTREQTNLLESDEEDALLLSGVVVEDLKFREGLECPMNDKEVLWKKELQN